MSAVTLCLVFRMLSVNLNYPVLSFLNRIRKTKRNV